MTTISVRVETVWRDIMSRRRHLALCTLIVASAVIVGAFLGLLTSQDRPWPYDISSRTIVNAKVERGKLNDLGMRRVIEYHEEDCWRQYDRRVVSVDDGPPQPHRTERLPAIFDTKLPVETSGKEITWTASLPSDFPCGPAYLAESVSAACTIFQRLFRPLRKDTIFTGFDVVGPGCS